MHEQTLTSRTMLLLLIREQIIQRVLSRVALLLLLKGWESQYCWFSEDTAAAWAESAAKLSSLLQPTNTPNFPCCLCHHLLPPPQKKNPNKAKFS